MMITGEFLLSRQGDFNEYPQHRLLWLTDLSVIIKYTVHVYVLLSLFFEPHHEKNCFSHICYRAG